MSPTTSKASCTDKFCTLPSSTCKSDCTDVINAAKKVIDDQTKTINDQAQTVTDLGVQLGSVTADRDSDRVALSEWYHNPFVMLGIGLVAGGMGALLLSR